MLSFAALFSFILSRIFLIVSLCCPTGGVLTWGFGVVVGTAGGGRVDDASPWLEFSLEGWPIWCHIPLFGLWEVIGAGASEVGEGAVLSAPLGLSDLALSILEEDASSAEGLTDPLFTSGIASSSNVS